MNRRPQLSIIAPDASPVEAAAVTAALTQFMRDTAPVLVAADQRPREAAWRRAALDEGVRREPLPPAPWQ